MTGALLKSNLQLLGNVDFVYLKRYLRDEKLAAFWILYASSSGIGLDSYIYLNVASTAPYYLPSRASTAALDTSNHIEDLIS